MNSCKETKRPSSVFQVRRKSAIKDDGRLKQFNYQPMSSSKVQIKLLCTWLYSRALLKTAVLVPSSPTPRVSSIILLLLEITPSVRWLAFRAWIAAPKLSVIPWKRRQTCHKMSFFHVSKLVKKLFLKKVECLSLSLQKYSPKNVLCVNLMDFKSKKICAH